MATKLSSFILCLSLALLSSTALSSVLSTGLDYWCSKTPYPAACKATFAHDPKHYSIPKKMSDFKKIAIESTLENALKVQSHNKWLGQKCRTEKEKAAWSDCLKLYEETITLLNRTVDPNTKCTEFDSQTWLSTGLTNLETCRAGFVELGVSDFVLPLMSNNVSKLISNSLSINNGSSTPAVTNQYKEGFPAWVKPGDRRLLQSTPATDVVVAQDGSGNYKTIKAALDAAAKRSGTKRFVIRVKSGVYKENLEIKLKNIYLLGDGLRSTIITGSRSVVGGSTTFNSATVAVTGDGFIASGITFRNTAGPENHQAVALRSGADLSVFYRCSFEGYQDTLYTHSQRQFYKECYIYGTVDFIFGNAAVVLQNCMIYARKPMSGQKNTITAQGRTDPNQNTGISIHDSRIMAAPDLKPVIGSVKTFLGRPWKDYSRTVFLQSYLDSLVDPAGWLEWDGNFALKTLYYGEYKNKGPGSGTSGRVKPKSPIFPTMNAFRLAGDITHLISILVLLLKIYATKSCSGISLKTQELYAVVFLARYLDLFTDFISVYNSVMKVVFILSSVAIVWCMRRHRAVKRSYDKELDTFRHYYLVGACFVFALLVHEKFTFQEVFWAFSIYLEAVAIIPQLVLLQRSGNVDNLTGQYVFFLGAYRALYILNWIYRYFTEAKFSRWIACISGLVQTALYADFFLLLLSQLEKQCKA